jgi:hypothetical protein
VENLVIPNAVVWASPVVAVDEVSRALPPHWLIVIVLATEQAAKQLIHWKKSLLLEVEHVIEHPLRCRESGAANARFMPGVVQGVR